MRLAYCLIVCLTSSPIAFCIERAVHIADVVTWSQSSKLYSLWMEMESVNTQQIV